MNIEIPDGETVIVRPGSGADVPSVVVHEHDAPTDHAPYRRSLSMELLNSQIEEITHSNGKTRIRLK